MFFSGAGVKSVVRPSPKCASAPLEPVKTSEGEKPEEPCTLAANDHQEYGLSHHGDPDDEEVIVSEEPESPEEGGPRVVRIPRARAQ